MTGGARGPLRPGFNKLFTVLVKFTKDYEYFEINANDFEVDAYIEFGTNEEKEKWVIIFGGWGSTKSRIGERKMNRNGKYIDTENKVYQRHTKKQWIAARYFISYHMI